MQSTLNSIEMFSISKFNDVTILSLGSITRLNVLNYELVQYSLFNLLKKKEEQKIVIDMDGITFIDSAGFGMMVEIFRTAAANEKQIFFRNLSDDLLELIRLMKLQHLFKTYEQICPVTEYSSFR